MALELTKRYSWARAEGGFDRTADENSRWEALLTANDIAGLARMTNLARQNRPRDPFAQMGYAYIASLQQGRTPQELMADARVCLATAALMPSDPMYDEYRGWCL